MKFFILVLTGLLCATYAFAGEAELSLERKVSRRNLLQFFSNLNKIKTQLESAVENFQSSNLCVLDGYDVNCCNKILNNTVCFDIDVDESELSIGISLTINNNTVISETLASLEPPPICATLPNLAMVTVCLRAHELAVSNGTFSACFQAEGKILGINVVVLDLNCVGITNKGLDFFGGDVVGSFPLVFNATMIANL